MTTYKIDGEKTRLSVIKNEVKKDSLKKNLGDYISSKELKKIGFKDSELRRWKDIGKIRAMKNGSFWYYSKQDILDTLKT